MRVHPVDDGGCGVVDHLLRDVAVEIGRGHYGDVGAQELAHPSTHLAVAVRILLRYHCPVEV